jgi:broad specificity phosphatase PhoE
MPGARATTRVHLVRHAAHSLIDRVLVGRMEGVPLSEEGRRQACSLTRRLGTRRVAGIYTSPRQRARETAHIIADRIGLTPEVTTRLDEINFGSWTGRTFSQLGADPAWRYWNEARSRARPPGGETMREAQARALHYISETHRARPGSTIVMVTHAEIIRAVVLHCLAWPLDAWQGVEIAPASVTTLDIRPSGSALVSLDQRAAA